MKATLVAAVISSLLDIRITLALSFTMAVMAGLMLVLVAVAGRAAKHPVLEGVEVRGFKGDELSARVRLASRRIRWVSARASSAVTGRGDCAVRVENGEAVIPLATTAAGRFMGLRLRLELNDPLGLFSGIRELVYEDFTLDVLPASLARPPSARRVALLTSGEVPAGSPGMGQELFSIDEYSPSSDVKNIIWKRVASSADERLSVRIRESNVPRTITIGLLETARRDGERVAWMDLLCEGVGLLAMELIDLGSAVDFLHGTSEGLAVRPANNPSELAEALMEFSGGVASDQFAGELVKGSDVVVTGMKELERPEIARSLMGMPSLLIHEEGTPVSLGERSLVFSGDESILPLLVRAVER